MKQLIKNTVKTVMIGACIALTSYSQLQAGLITTNLSAGTTVVYGARSSVYQVDVTSSTANLIRIYDTASNALTYVIGSYTGSSNYTLNITNLQTNGIFVYSASTQYMIQTNIYLGGNFRTNYTVPQTTNGVTASVSLFVPAGLTASVDAIDLTFLNGITVTATNSCQISIYTRN